MEIQNSKEKFLFQLTTDEFISMFNGLLNEVVPRLVEQGIKEHLKDANQDQANIITIDEASKILSLTKKTIYTKVSRMEMPVLTRGRPLMFSRNELEIWLKNGRPSNAETLANNYLNKTKNI